jgi:urease accessory protein
MSRKTRIAAATAGLLAGLATVPASAHHPLGGAMPATALEGLLSGFGHPVIELFHLVFLVGFGILLGHSGSSARRMLYAIAAFVTAGAFGVVVESVMAFGAVVDVLVALTLLALAAALWFAPSAGGTRLTIAAAAAGAAHGLAFGEAVIGAEPTPIAFYLVGLALIEAVLIGLAALGARHGERRAARWLRTASRVAAIAAAASGAWLMASA